jgi:hypothetical protein
MYYFYLGIHNNNLVGNPAWYYILRGLQIISKSIPKYLDIGTRTSSFTIGHSRRDSDAAANEQSKKGNDLNIEMHCGLFF